MNKKGSLRCQSLEVSHFKKTALLTDLINASECLRLMNILVGVHPSPLYENAAITFFDEVYFLMFSLELGKGD